MSTKDLSKMGSARVSIEEFGSSLCIHKQNASDVEVNFYQHAASKLRDVNVPKLYKVQDKDLFIELIPNRMTLKELQTNSSVFEQLASIHCSKYKPCFSTKEHHWSAISTELALEALSLPRSSQSTIVSIQALSQVLFEHSCLISGDTNDGNWGIRQNGELVLFDWERFGYGSPAIDLAPLVQGLGSMDEYASIIERYTQHNSSFAADELTKHLVIAKCWIVIEVINILISRNKPEAAIYIDWYQKNLPAWLGAVENAL
ncbi:phosphotransferase family protein [Vibrio cholerae]|uniref:phosphotransferase family protein n=1 Tax=Vibrio cholerae TaxID=666 RepID=UPI0011DA28DA|nr:phosphotransferase [Vibrio cholerae]EGR1329813.1 choline kinase [Vibrio cholerae]TXX83760.1 phosphotransferase [Vibrio cholerae]GHY56408.1 choline kinase [Vibrio cholerae]